MQVIEQKKDRSKKMQVINQMIQVIDQKCKS